MKSAIILSLSAIALAAPRPEAHSQGSNVPVNAKRSSVTTNDDGSVDYSGFLSMLRTTVRKYNNAMELPAAVENSSLNWKRANVPLVDQNMDGEDVLYYGDGDVSGQTFTFGKH